MRYIIVSSFVQEFKLFMQDFKLKGPTSSRLWGHIFYWLCLVLLFALHIAEMYAFFFIVFLFKTILFLLVRNDLKFLIFYVICFLLIFFLCVRFFQFLRNNVILIDLLFAIIGTISCMILILLGII